MSAPAARGAAMPAVLVGVFVGGRGHRMGGVAKGNLLCEGRSILDRTLAACAGAAEALGVGAFEVALVGDSSAYSTSGVARIGDDPAGVGPMGGLRALLSDAQRRNAVALALANDMPYLEPALIARLVASGPEAAALAPRRDERWEPLFARYRPAPVLPVIDAALLRSDTSLQVIFAALGSAAAVLALSEREREVLHDWDRPSDVTRPCPKSPP